MKRRSRHLIAALLMGAFMVTCGTASAAEAVDELIEAAPAKVAINVPPPGHSESWAMSVKNLTSDRYPLVLSVDGASDRLFAGEHPLALELTDSRTGELVYSGPVEAAIDSPVALADLKPGSTAGLVGTVTLPSQAGNEYQGASGQLVFEFRAAVADDAITPPRIADTGRAGFAWVILAVLGTIGIAGGAGILRRGRKTA